MEKLLLMGDFETTKDIIDWKLNSKKKLTPVYSARVWASCLTSIEENKVLHLENSLEKTMEYLKTMTKLTNVTLFYHNLKFDGEFIIQWLLKNGFSHGEKLGGSKTFTTLITDMGIYYQIILKFGKGKRAFTIDIRDSLKLLPMPVKALSKAFGLEMLKGEIDFEKERKIDHEITEEERKYIENDCLIVGACLKQTFSEGLTKLTVASNAMNSYKISFGRPKFKAHYPVLSEEEDKFMRRSYKGGYTYCNPKFQGKDINEKGLTYDVNSLYPSVMYSQVLPYGQPIYYEGDYPNNEYYPLYIQRINCRFKLRKGFIPTIQLKKMSALFSETEYLKSSGLEKIDLYLTSVDLELFFKHYVVTNVTYIEGYMFKGKVGLFKEYIDYWIGIKEQATIDGNEGLRTIAKLMLNSLYGKFCSSPKSATKSPYLNEDNITQLELTEHEDRPTVYVPMGAFITSYARKVTITAFQENKEICAYCDTDSIHLITDKVPTNIDISETKLGAWKLECEFTYAKFIRAKTYMEEYFCKKKGKVILDVKCAGMPLKCKEKVTKENFKKGLKVGGKLTPKRCLGGVVLIETEFTMK